MILIGETGQLARAFAAEFSAHPRAAEFLGRNHIDLSRVDAIDAALDAAASRLENGGQDSAKVIVNTAAYTKVDRAETERELARAVNAAAPARIAKWAARRGYRFLHYSTDYVFPGVGEVPWKESDAIAPVNHYGATKAEGERLVREAGGESLILRTSWVYGSGRNFPAAILAKARAEKRVSVVNDQFGSPTSAADLARASLALIDAGETAFTNEVYHCTNAGYVSWFEFANRIVAEAKAVGKVDADVRCEPVTSAAFPTVAVRPANSRLSMRKIEERLGVRMRPWERALSEWLGEKFSAAGDSA